MKTYYKHCSSNMPDLNDLSFRECIKQGWKIQNGKLVKSIVCINDDCAWEVATLICERANKFNHHPELVINGNIINIAFVTHSSNSISKIDGEMAKDLDNCLVPYALKYKNKNDLDVSEIFDASNVESFKFKNFASAFAFVYKLQRERFWPESENVAIAIVWGGVIISADTKVLESIEQRYQNDYLLANNIPKAKL